MGVTIALSVAAALVLAGELLMVSSVRPALCGRRTGNSLLALSLVLHAAALVPGLYALLELSLRWRLIAVAIVLAQSAPWTFAFVRGAARS